MDCASVISLSSKDSREESESLASIVTVSSEVPGVRVPVSWESDQESQKSATPNVDLEYVPSTLEKVAAWIQTCTYIENVEYDHFPEIITISDNPSTCIRYDFDKTTPTVNAPKSCFTRTTPLFSYMEKAKKNVNPKPNTERPNGSHVGNTETCNFPLSPDTQKKELCSYLQLMKPEDEKDNFFIEYRRSGRVKNNDEKVEKEKVKKKNPSECAQSVKSDDSSEKVGTKMSHIKRKRISEEKITELLPLPPEKCYREIVDFEDSVKEIVEESVNKKKINNGCLKKVEKRRRFNFGLKLPQKFKKGFFTYKRINLRSNRRLRDVSLDKLIQRKKESRKKARKKILKDFKKIAAKSDAESAACDIISVHTNSDDENVDLKNFVDDMLELDKMSEEHRKSVIESRILASSSITNLISKRASQEADVQRAYKIFSDLSNERKNSDEKENSVDESERSIKGTNNNDIPNNQTEISSGDENDQNKLVMALVSEHDYAIFSDSQTAEICAENEEEIEYEEDDDSTRGTLSPVPVPNLEVLPVSRDVEVKSLHRSLTVNTRKLFLNNYGLHNWSAGANYNKKLNHAINISKKHGPILAGFYQDFNLIITQQKLVSFWTQSALGNVLGAQNMWIPKSNIERITLNSSYSQKTALDMVITTETSVAFVELWTKEHKSDVREVPLADVFATVYFWRVRQAGLEKKALQLEKIQGFSDDVQYTVLKWYPKIIVSWHFEQGLEKKTKIRSYHLAADFQTVASISEIQPVQHYVSSLHNIEDCDSLVIGCGENKITLWNVEYGYIVATVEMLEIQSPLSTLWVKCDRGFLFIIQECVEQELRLIAINGMNHSWKKLQNYSPPANFDSLKGVCIDNGILVAYYAQGILCWNAQTGKLIVEEVPTECEYIPSGDHVIMIVNENIGVRHSLSHLITDS